MPADSAFSIAVLPGDGIGAEVIDVTLELLDAVQQRTDCPSLYFARHPAGAQHYVDTGDALPATTLAAMRSADAVLFGAMGLPHVRYPDGTEVVPQLEIRMELDLYAGVRPIRVFEGLPSVLADSRAKDIDFVLIREQTEGLFYARGRGVVDEDSRAYDTMLISREGTTRVSEYAFRLAAQRKARRGHARVTCVDKANVFTSMAFFRKIFDEVAARHPDLEHDHAYVDAMALNLVKAPWNWDVMVTENMFGDILSDLAGGLIGSMGMAPSGDIGDRHALFQPAHGTAPDIAGQGKANPIATFLSAAMMLDWLAERHDEPRCAYAAECIESAVSLALAKRCILPYEFGGTDGTVAITQAVISELALLTSVVAA